MCAGVQGGQVQEMVDQAEIHRKVASDKVEERKEAVDQLRDNFADLPDKEEAWKDLIRLTEDEDDFMRLHAADALGSAFQHIPKRKEAWRGLHRMTGDKDGFVRTGVAYALGSAFQHVSDKEEAWEDLHQLTGDEDDDVRWGAADAIGFAFLHILDKRGAWKDLIRLTKDEDLNVQCHAADALGSAFQHVPERKEAWRDLHWLTEDDDWGVRYGVARMLGSIFPHIPNKKEAWNDLIRLTDDIDWDAPISASHPLLKTDEAGLVRISANHSIGRASIFKAIDTENEDDFKSELKNAIEFFERSSKEATFFVNPSRFCLPFYRSFYTITFGKAGAEGVVQKYLAEAKSASEGSKNKELLLEAVENLANALSESQKVTDFDATKSDLNACMWYCNRAEDLISDAADGAPGAARILRRGLPTIDDTIRGNIREIQEGARAVCKQTQETPLEELGLATARYAHDLPTQDSLALKKAFGSMARIARDWCEHLPTDKKAYVFEQLKNLPGTGLSEQGAVLGRVFEYVQENSHIPKIQTVHVSETQEEIVRIAVAQFCFELTESFPFVLKNKDKVKTKVFSALETAKRDGANIVCLPELCLCEDWISEIEEQCPDMLVIGGSFYKDNQNTCPVIMESDAVIPCQPKITPAVTEYDMIPGAKIYRYETRFGKFVILICMDFDDLAHYFREADIDMIFCPSFNSANERFWSEAHSHVERTPSYILIANTGLHGGTSIFGQLDNKYFGELADRGYNERGDPTCKLCEVKDGCEEVILADFNLIHKSVQKPTPSNRSKVIKSVDHIKKIPIQPDRSRSKSKIGNE
jgi:HEAT repeat protein/predicted amidohydrolase